MVNADIHTLTEPDGTPVTNVAFDLSREQLAATSHALAEMVVERHRGQSLEMDDVLALRELTGVRDEVDRLAGAGGHASLVMPLGRFIAFHDAVDDYVLTRTDRGWARDADEEALPYLGALLAPMADLRARGLTATLGSQTPST